MEVAEGPCCVMSACSFFSASVGNASRYKCSLHLRRAVSLFRSETLGKLRSLDLPLRNRAFRRSRPYSAIAKLSSGRHTLHLASTRPDRKCRPQECSCGEFQKDLCSSFQGSPDSMRFHQADNLLSVATYAGESLALQGEQQALLVPVPSDGLSRGRSLKARCATRSLAIHLPQCQKKWLDQEMLKDPRERRPLPEAPKQLAGAAPKTAKEIEAYNNLANKQFEEKSMNGCPYCNRTFRQGAASTGFCHDHACFRRCSAAQLMSYWADSLKVKILV